MQGLGGGSHRRRGSERPRLRAGARGSLSLYKIKNCQEEMIKFAKNFYLSQRIMKKCGFCGKNIDILYAC